MKYYKITDNAYVLSIGKVETDRSVVGEISEEEYGQLERIITSKPEAPEGCVYRLTTNGRWVAEPEEVDEWVE